MKKILCCILLCAIIVNCCGYVLIYWNLKHVYKYSFLASVNSFELQKITQHLVISKNDALKGSLTRVEDDEIKYFGRMYDILREYSKHDTLHIFCVSDENEDYLNKYFEENYKNYIEQKSRKSPLKNIFSLEFPFALADEHFRLNYNTTGDILFSVLVTKASLIVRETPTPPPQIIS